MSNGLDDRYSLLTHLTFRTRSSVEQKFHKKGYIVVLILSRNHLNSEDYTGPRRVRGSGSKISLESRLYCFLLYKVEESSFELRNSNTNSVRFL